MIDSKRIDYTMARKILIDMHFIVE